MLTDLREINRILLGTRDLSTEEGALIENVIKYCSEIVLEGRIVNHQDTIEFCLSIGLLKRKQDRITISELGDQFLFYNKEEKFTLNDKQKKLISKQCFLKGGFVKNVRPILEQFKPDHGKMTFVWSKEFEEELVADNDLLSLLIQSEILFASREVYLVNPQYAYLVSSFKASHKMNSEDLEEELSERNEIGKIAEDIVMEFEKKRLQDSKCEVESNQILKISEIDVAAGYDVMSFDGEGIEHDRFIEVKGTQKDDIFFYISKNELDVARIMGDKYWIYFVGGVDKITKTARSEPQMFQNPINTLLKDKDIEQECWKIQVKRKKATDSHNI